MPLDDKRQAQFDIVCDRIAEGQSLRAICEQDDMPDKETIRRWLSGDKEGELCAQYARAREEQADFYADDIIAIADDTGRTPEDRRVKIDARKWVASKLKPKRYGDKLALGGADDLPAIRQEVQERADSFMVGIAASAARRKPDTKH